MKIVKTKCGYMSKQKAVELGLIKKGYNMKNTKQIAKHTVREHIESDNLKILNRIHKGVDCASCGGDGMLSFKGVPEPCETCFGHGKLYAFKENIQAIAKAKVE